MECHGGLSASRSLRALASAFTAAFLVSLAATPAAALLVPLSLRQLVDQSETVTVGTVSAMDTEVLDGHAVTWVTLQTEEHPRLGPAPKKAYNKNRTFYRFR